MRFRDYIIFDEAMGMPTDGLRVRDYGSSVTCHFDHGGDRYKVEMLHGEAYGIPEVWEVEFIGPGGVSTTGVSGTSSSAIYSRMLGCIKKLFETRRVNGLSFSPAEDAMLVPYDLFYRKYLRPDPPAGMGFLKVSPSLYLSKGVIRSSGIGGLVLPAARVSRDNVAMAKAEKLADRIMDRIEAGREIPGDSDNLKRLEAEIEGLRAKGSRRAWSDMAYAAVGSARERKGAEATPYSGPGFRRTPEGGAP